MADLIRVIDIGGAGVRRLDLPLNDDLKAENIKDPDIKTPHTLDLPPINDLPSLLSFVEDGLEKDQFKGVAYSVAGVIHGHDIVVNSPNAHFLDGITLAKATNERTKLQSVVSNDMEAAVTGMAALLGNPPYFMGITWSSGIGLRIFRNGQIISVAEGGHMVLDPSPFAPLCGCGKRGCAEAFLGGHSIKRRVITETQARQLTKGLNIEFGEGKGRCHPCKFLDDAYLGKYSGKNPQVTAWAKDFYDRVVEAMGIFLANIQTLLNLPLIVWKGTVAYVVLFGDLKLRDQVRAAMKKNLIDPAWAEKEHLKFQKTPGLGDRDAFVGAAEVFRSHPEYRTP